MCFSFVDINDGAFDGDDDDDSLMMMIMRITI